MKVSNLCAQWSPDNAIEHAFEPAIGAFDRLTGGSIDRCHLKIGVALPSPS
jgi:hypothetical protein